MSKLYFKYGAMNSGKSTVLLQIAHNYEELGYDVYIVKPAIDNKGGDKIVSRLGIEKKVDFLWKADEPFVFNGKSILTLGCILIDEAQFLTEEQVNELDKLIYEFDIPIIAFGLRTDFLGRGFEGSNRLLQLADSIEEIKTMSKQGTKATRHIRLINGEVDVTGNQVVIDDGSVEYLSVNRKEFYDYIKRKPLNKIY